MMAEISMFRRIVYVLGDDDDVVLGNDDDGVLGDDDVKVRVPSLGSQVARLDFDIGALGEDSLTGNSDTLFAYLDNVYFYFRATITLQHINL